jgi:hypothetical protein
LASFNDFLGQHEGHGSSLQKSSHPSLRKVTTPQKRHIESLFAQPAVPLRHIKASLQEQFPENNTTWKDLNNMRYKHNKAALAGLTPTQALIKVFDNERIKYAVRFDDLDPLRPTALLWTYPWNEQIWKQF